MTDSIMEQNSSLSIIMFIALFGGSTFLLFLLCYCCQRRTRDDAFSPIATAMEPSEVQVTVARSPPPAYGSVIKKNSIVQIDPPPYEEAVAGLEASGYV
ncbi:uncharacterized protein LOC135377771 isoform X2 [Ornithodoros turicata]